MYKNLYKGTEVFLEVMVAIWDIIHAAGKFEVGFTTLFIGLIIGKLLGKVVTRAFDEAELHQVAPGMSAVLGRIVQYAIYAATLIALLQLYQITRIVLEVVAAVVGVVIVIALLLVVRDAVPNTIAGLLLSGRLKKLKGKNVRIGKVQGKLSHIGWLACVLENKDVHSVPHVYTWKNL